MSVYPEVRVYADPLEGLDAQLTELRGLIKRVPPLIDADRERRWKEINERLPAIAKRSPHLIARIPHLDVHVAVARGA